ncbi:MAG: 30S ribosomal protein S3 [Candidatus Buchananbacteria bacterium]|nr:30S ribosomal protein S3 [Candidatus Buchananbacteria bacterium]
MGQKVHPKIFRIGNLYTWNSKWYAGKNYAQFLKQDVLVRKFLIKSLRDAGVEKVEIERSAANINVVIYAAKPGIIIGRGGQGVEDLKKKLKKQFLEPKTNLNITIQEVKEPNMSAQLVAGAMAIDIEKRMPFRRVLKQAISRVEKAGAKGIKVCVAGRLNGSEIARTEILSSGSLPLHTLRADIDYARTVASTTYGVIGIKVWIYKGQKFGTEPEVFSTPRTERPKFNKRPKTLAK